MRYVPRLPEPLVREAARHTHALWGDGRTLPDHVAYTLEQLRRGEPELLRYVGLVDDAGHLVASIKRYAVALGAGGSTLRAVGIGAVFTDPARRKAGAATALLRAVLEEADDHGYDAALLWSDIDPAFYARLGFVALPALDAEVTTADLPRDGALPLRDATDEDVDALLALFAREHRDHALHAVRTRALFRYFRWRNEVRAQVSPASGEPRAYVLTARALRDPSALFVLEWAAPDARPDEVAATLRALADERGAHRIIGPAWRRREGIPARIRPRSGAIPMVAPVGRRALPAFDREAAFLGPFDHF